MPAAQRMSATTAAVLFKRFPVMTSPYSNALRRGSYSNEIEAAVPADRLIYGSPFESRLQIQNRISSMKIISFPDKYFQGGHLVCGVGKNSM